MYAYVDLYFSPEGTGPLEISERLRDRAGLSFIVGPHDLLFEWHSVEEFRDRLARLHDALAGTGATYRVQSVEETPEFVEPVSWPPTLARSAEHPAFAAGTPPHRK